MRHALTGRFLGLAMMLGSVAEASGQVVIDMPPPSPSVAPIPALAGSSTAQPLAVTAAAPMASPSRYITTAGQSADAVDVGDLALARYSQARQYPGDLYDSSPHYAGVRYYSYPVSYAYPFWFGFPFFGCW